MFGSVVSAKKSKVVLSFMLWSPEMVKVVDPIHGGGTATRVR
jgi:hypothetical protein